MSRILYFDGFSGASGDMILGALVDAGVPLDVLRAALGSLALDGVTLEAERVMRAGVSATKVRVLVGGRRPDAAPSPGDAAATTGGHDHGHSHDHGHPHDHGHVHDHGHAHDRGHPHDHGHRSLRDIAALVGRSALSPAAQTRAMAWMTRLAEAEAAIHNVPVEQIHLHEVGAVDSIVDIVGAVCALEYLAADRVECAPLNVGGGTVKCAHGMFPVPAPATLRLLTGVPTFSAGPRVELLTPTGALVLTSASQAFGSQPPMRVTAVGYGAGDRDFADRPNVLRVLVGDTDAAQADTITVVECEIDDMTGQVFGDVMDRLFEAGAVDVYFAPVHMKKNRPGTLVTVLVQAEHREAIVDLLFAETTTLGVRYHEVRRECLDREHRLVATPHGEVRMKLGHRRGHLVNAVPEFDDCRRLSRERGVPVKDVQAAAVRAWLDRSTATH